MAKAEDELYKEQILELNRHPLNKKLLADFDVEAREFNPVCGDDIILRIKFDAAGKVVDLGYQGVGCAISQAATSVVTDAAKGEGAARILAMDMKTVADLLGGEIIPTRTQCALLGLKAIQRAVGNRV